MNKHLFRLVFNKAYGFLVPVSEIAKSHTKCARRTDVGWTKDLADFASLPRTRYGVPTKAASFFFNLARKLLPVMAILGISSLTIPTAFANIVADLTALPQHQPHVTQTANGTPQVNIQTPSAGGVSRNVYKQFDVNKPGAILNNSKNNVATQQGGWIQGNPNLKNGTARIILNEVNSSKPSQLRGYIEVAGDRAQVVVANPSGITCDGCGFINASRGTLTTGKPVMNSQGNLERYDVQGGVIRIEGAGFDGRHVSTADLISRATQIDAAIQANELNVTVGTQAVNIEGTPIYLLPPKVGETKPEVAVDVSSKGGMHVGKVLLTISNDVVESMRNQGYMTAQDDFILTADGDIINKNQINAGKNVKINTKKKIQNTSTGTIYSKGDVALESENEIENDGIIAAQNHTSLAGSKIKNNKNAVLASGMQTDGKLLNTGNLTLAARENIISNGQNLSGGDQTWTALNIDLADSQTSGNNLTFNAINSLNARRAKFAAKQNLSTTASELDFSNTEINAQNLTFSAHNTLNASNAIFVMAQDFISNSNSANFINTKASARNMQFRTFTGDFDATQAQLLADENLVLDVAQDAITNQAQIIANQVGITAINLKNQQGTIYARNMNSGAGENLFPGSAGGSPAAFNLTLGGTLDNTFGTLASEGDSNFNIAKNLINTNGILNSAGNLLLTIGASNQKGKTLSTLKNSNGTIFSGKNLTLNTDNLTSEGKFLSQGDINIALTQDYTHTQDSQIQANGSIIFKTLGKFTNTAQMLAGETLNVNANQIDNTIDGAFIAKNTWLNAVDTFTNRGLVDGASTLIQAGNNIYNLGTGRIYGDNLSLGATTLTNDVENNAAAVIAARNNLNIGAQFITNREHALIFSAGDMNIGGALDVNVFPGSAGGSPAPNGTFANLPSPGAFFAGRGVGGEGIIGSANTLNNNSATIEAKGNLTINAQQINNTNEHFATQNVLLSQQNILQGQLKGSSNRYDGSQIRQVRIPGNPIWHLETPEGSSPDFYLYRFTRSVYEDQITQSDPGKILSGGTMHIVANNLLNDRSQIISGGDLVAEINTLNNIEAKGQRRTNDSGTLEHFWTDGNDQQEYTQTGYYPADNIQTITLLPATFIGNTTHQGSGKTIDPIQEIPGVISDDPNAPPIVIRTGGVNTKIPDNSLYRILPNPTQGYLIETDPQFAGYKNWLSSAYMMQQLNLDSGMLQLRLGDGFYEQQLLREQINQLTGRQFLENYSDEEAQFRALMDSGIAFAEEYHLIPGVALSAEQMSRLTSDIVWLVEKDITMPDGSIQKALVPQLYARVKPGEITGDNALISGKNVQLALNGDLVNQGTIAGSNKLTLLAENIQNLKGRITATDTTLYANTDLNNLGGRLAAINSLTALAGRDLTIASTTQSSSSSQGTRTNIDSVGSVVVGGFAGSAGGSSPGSAGSLPAKDSSSPSITLAAGRDVNLNAAFIGNGVLDAVEKSEPRASASVADVSNSQISSNATSSSSDKLNEKKLNGIIKISAGNNLNLGTIKETQQQSNTFDADNWLKQSSRVDVGTVMQTSGDIQLVAGNDITTKAANITSDFGKLTLAATNNINVTTGEKEQTQASASKSTHKGFLNTQTTTTRDSFKQNQNIGSTFSSDATTLQAGKDINITGSNIVSTYDTNLIAGNNISIKAAYDTLDVYQQKQVKESGILNANMLHGITEVGVQKQTDTYEGSSRTAAGAVIGSLMGDVNVIAANAYQQIGSNVITPTGNINVLAKTIDIIEAQNTNNSKQTSKYEKNSLSKTASSPIGDAILTSQQMNQASQQTDDGRMKLLAGVTTGLAVKNAYDAVKADPKMGGGVSVNYAIGTSKSETVTTQQANWATGSALNAGGNINLLTTGDANNSHITVRGSTLNAGNNILLNTEGDINLLAAKNQQTQQTTSSSSSASVGAGVTIGASQKGANMSVNVNASVSGSKGNSDGTDITWTNTYLNAGNKLTLESGGDTTLRGAIASGLQVIANVSGNLNIQSLQDSSTYDSEQSSYAVSVSVPVYGYGSASFSANFSDTDMHSNYASVTEQSGIRAGDGGFQINVKGNTDLIGGIISSTILPSTGASSARGEGLREGVLSGGYNSLTTGSLTYRDIQNIAEYDASSTSFGGGYSGAMTNVSDPANGGWGNALKSSFTGNNSGISGIGTNQSGQAQPGSLQTPGTALPGYNGFSATPPVAMNASDSASSTTRSGISSATITITDPAKQARTGSNAASIIAGLNRNVETGKDTTNALAPIFNEQEIQAGFQIVSQLTAEMGQFLDNRAKEADAKKEQAKHAEQLAGDPNNGLSDEQRQALLTQASDLRNEANTIDKDWGAGGTYRQITTALTAAASGNISASNTEFVQNMLVNYVQQKGAAYIGDLVVEGKLTEGSPAHAALHAILACGGAAASNQDCGAGALGAATSSLLTNLFAPPGPDETASESEAKRNLIATLVAGIAANTDIDSSTATNSAIAAVENNWLATQQIVQANKEIAEAEGALETLQVMAKWTAISGKQDIITTTGIGVGLGEAGVDNIEAVAGFLADPITGLNGIKELISSPEARAQLGEAVYTEISNKIDSIDKALTEGGDYNAFQLGRDLGNIVFQAATVATVAGGAVKGSAELAKLGIKATASDLERMAAKVPGTIRPDLTDHLVNARVSGSQISGGHNLNNFTSTLNNAGGKVVSKTEISPGIYEIQYKLPNAKREATKTVYDSSLYPDMPTMTNTAANKALIQYHKTGNADQLVIVNGIEFTVPIKMQNGQPYVPTAFPVRLIK